MYRHLLTALDDSALASTTISRSIAFARSVGARITFFYAVPDYAATSEGALHITMEPGSFGEAAVGASNAILVKALSAAEAGGISADALVTTSDHPAQAIVEAARARACDLIFMSTRGPQRGLRGLFNTSVTSKVLQLTGIPVLVASIDANQPNAAAQHALAVIQDEHRSMAAVLRGFQQLARQARAPGGTLNADLARQMLAYMHAFPEVQHHPKEESQLFRLLRKRTKNFDSTLDELVRQHLQERELLDAVEDALDRHAAGAPEALDVFNAAVQRLAGALWDHMSLEETIILKGAREHLNEQDWQEIATAFGANTDPGLREDEDPTLKKMFIRIANAMPQAPAHGTPPARQISPAPVH